MVSHMNFEKRKSDIADALASGLLDVQEWREVYTMIENERRELCLIDELGRILRDQEGRINFSCRFCNGRTESKGYRSAHPEYQRRICYNCHKESLINPKSGEMRY